MIFLRIIRMLMKHQKREDIMEEAIVTRPIEKKENMGISCAVHGGSAGAVLNVPAAYASGTGS